MTDVATSRSWGGGGGGSEAVVELLEINLATGRAGGDELTLAERCTLLRRRLGVTQAELAAAAGGMQQSHVSAWERGKRRLSDETVARLIAALNELAREDEESAA